MKKILALIVLAVTMVSCYEEYLLDYPYTATYFYLQQDVRTFVVGEGMKFKVGVTMGGVSDNTIDRNVSFTLDNSLINPALLDGMKIASQSFIKDAVANVSVLEPLPSSYYTLSNPSLMVIPKGWYTGEVLVKADSLAFTADSLKTTRMASYAIPFRITNCPEIDTILESKRTNVIGVMLENKLFGNYWHGGQAVISGPTRNETVNYFTTIPTAENRIWNLTSAGPTTLIVNNFMDNTSFGGDTIMYLALKGTSVSLYSGPDAPFVITSDGACTFNNSKLLQDRRIYLKYQFTDADGNLYRCTDTLRFRNRIRDGINEWQDENPANYTK
ncbi:MAG TPA: DUF1735 domain-containing protein [Bacteroidales bacterium]|nr:DUF1735 domain-containing protein [Bacteroidales bacterium]HPF04058.1 DUF1735 domain-containing protein [Bacteroidales bacterium]HPJ60857.1 DUF1735 domain-containing protein [Bacteroidales bacterium]HPR12533.1 DUF1735 domain-containing protein [Bacteroidales bacterium]HRW86722.1 DUF1735 domain-containing protein [Bacteroidales bacterium]